MAITPGASGNAGWRRPEWFRSNREPLAGRPLGLKGSDPASGHSADSGGLGTAVALPQGDKEPGARGTEHRTVQPRAAVQTDGGGSVGQVNRRPSKATQDVQVGCGPDDPVRGVGHSASATAREATR